MNDNIKLTDYENALLGCPSKYHSVYQRLNINNNQSVDIISFGCLLFEMSTGKVFEHPFPELSLAQEPIQKVLNVLLLLNFIYFYY